MTFDILRQLAIRTDSSGRFLERVSDGSSFFPVADTGEHVTCTKLIGSLGDFSSLDQGGGHSISR